MSDVPAAIPCPVQRALWKAGLLGEVVPLREIARLLVRAFGFDGAQARKVRGASMAIAAISNGVAHVARNVSHGFRPCELRGGPLDKRGGGTRILSQQGEYDEAEFARFESFARQFPGDGGADSELGWGPTELRRYLDANQQRAGSGFVQRRILMEGELPQLLRLMGKGDGELRYLSAREVKALYRDSEFPVRIRERLQG